jgi:hypothetical protein
MSQSAIENGQNLKHEELSHEMGITKKGYVYIYISNESVKPADVFFDDLTVSLLSFSNIIQENGIAITTESGQNILTEN